ncbi:amidase 1 isoform X2 [Wolffia australiana]
MDNYGAFIEKFELRRPESPTTPMRSLDGLTFAVKEMFDVEDYVSGFGNPDWRKTHPAATSTAPTVLALIEAGALCVGKTVMDEMAYSINGENKHYGTPINPCAKDRVPGGSSSGSAVAVAAKLVDFSVGSDTGGSVRVPASYCGIFGIRPSHGVVDITGAVPMAQSFDTVGWFARDPAILARVGEVLLPSCHLINNHSARILIPEDCFQKLSPLGSRPYRIFTESDSPLVGVIHFDLGQYIAHKVPSLSYFMDRLPEMSAMKNGLPVLSALSYAMQTLQRFEFRVNHGEWVNATKPNLGPGIAERVWEAVKSKEEDAIPYCLTVQAESRSALNELLKDDGILVLPTLPGPPPKLNTEPSLLTDFRLKAFSLLSIAGMSGLCQVTIPLGMDENLPISVSVLARHGGDRFLLDLVKNLFSGHQASVDQEAGSLLRQKL